MDNNPDFIPETLESADEEFIPPEISEKANEPSSLWATYSMLRSMVDIKHNINIYNYSRLIAFLKQKNKGFKSTKALTLSAEQINQFLGEAPDNQYLPIKVALIYGVQGACRRKELTELIVGDIEDKGDMLLVKIPDTKTGRPRSFVVTDDFYHIYKKYAKSRPTNLATKRFFVSYRNGKCRSQNIGINTFGSMPKIIATFLKLANPESYTGHSFRRTSATLLADSGVDLLLTIKRHGGWKSSPTAEGYIEDSVGNKKRIGQQIASTISAKPSTSREQQPPIDPANEAAVETAMDIEITDKANVNFEILDAIPSKNLKNLNITFSNCSNLTIYFNESRKN
ncbi:uncharacterized protein LOC141530326 [Cotesia typhae]|uniref:uncharacterized protein LOC141530326 n=1 Tax=Cotesia typhae TaxID=2053667 RepID=UPI003D6922EE